MVAIIALLIAILLPSLPQARDHAQKAICNANFKQVGTALFMYTNDSKH